MSGPQVVTYRPDGTQPRWLGSLGHVSGLRYSSTCPGGPSQLSLTLAREARWRTDALNPGRIVKVWAGGVQWDGKLDEPAYSDGAGWQVVAHGAGTFGSEFDAVWTGTWGTGVFDNAVDAAISRGLRWVNPGIGAPSGIFAGQKADSGSLKISDLLDLGTSKGGLLWQVTPQAGGNYLSVFAIPATVTRLLIATEPVARTLGGDVNHIEIRYESDADYNVPAVFSLTSVTEPDSVAAHGQMEEYLDLSSVGLQTQAAAQAVGTQVLKRYKRASFAGPFTVRRGQYLTTGGTPVDLACEEAGTVVRLIMTDYAYGGEISPLPVTFVVGSYEYDDDSGTAVVTPFQKFATSFSNLLGAAAARGPTRADRRYAHQEWLERRAARREAERDARQLARFKRRHPHWLRHHDRWPRF